MFLKALDTMYARFLQNSWFRLIFRWFGYFFRKAIELSEPLNSSICILYLFKAPFSLIYCPPPDI